MSLTTLPSRAPATPLAMELARRRLRTGEVAQAVGVTRGHLRAIAAGERPANGPMRLALAAVLDADVDTLFPDDDPGAGAALRAA
jgi:hypothetical protein